MHHRPHMVEVDPVYAYRPGPVGPSRSAGARESVFLLNDDLAEWLGSG